MIPWYNRSTKQKNPLLSQIWPVTTPHESSLRHDQRVHNHKLHCHQPFKTKSGSQDWHTITMGFLFPVSLKQVSSSKRDMTTPYLKGVANTHVTFLQKHSIVNLQGSKLRHTDHTCYVLHYFKFFPLLPDHKADMFLNIFRHPYPDFLCELLSNISISSEIPVIFLAILSHIEILADISSAILFYFSWNILQVLLWHNLSANATNPFHHSWGPARPHWTRMIAVGVRHTTLNSRSQLRSGTQHWTHEIIVGVQNATLNSQDRGSQDRDRRRTRKEEEEKEYGKKRNWHKNLQPSFERWGTKKKLKDSHHDILARRWQLRNFSEKKIKRKEQK